MHGSDTSIRVPLGRLSPLLFLCPCLKLWPVGFQSRPVQWLIPSGNLILEWYPVQWSKHLRVFLYVELITIIYVVVVVVKEPPFT